MSPARTRVTLHTGEALVLRTWPFHEADLLVSLFTREHGRLKGVARHAMRSRRRFGGALEPMTHVRAAWAERPREELVRLDAFEIIASPLTAPVDLPRLAALSLLAEVLDELPEGAVDDPVFRLVLTVLPHIHAAAAAQHGAVNLPVTYFCLWMNRLLGWLPELSHCVLCHRPLAGHPAFYSPIADGLTCADDRRPQSATLTPADLADALHILREPIATLAAHPWPSTRSPQLRRFAIETLERHLEHRLQSARTLLR